MDETFAFIVLGFVAVLVLIRQASSISRVFGVLEERRRLEEETVGVARRVERLVSGSFSKGQMGENLLASRLKEFPPEILTRDVRISGRVCEFAMRMPDGKLLAIDSKWAAFDLVQLMGETSEVRVKEELRAKIEARVCQRIADVAGYVDAAVTLPMAVAAVPDSVFEACRKAHTAAVRSRVVLISYSMAVPYLLSVWNLYGAYSREIDSKTLLEQVDEASILLGQVSDKLEQHLSRGLTMVSNAAMEARTILARASALLSHPEREEGART